MSDRSVTSQFKFNQTMLRIKDPVLSLEFYRKVLGMQLLAQADFEEYQFSLFFLGYASSSATTSEKADFPALRSAFAREGVLELTHNWGTEADDAFVGYHSGNNEPKGFGHIGLCVPDVYEACKWFDQNAVKFVKRPDDGNMKGLAFITDPDGYWIEILEASRTAQICTGTL
jgi:lactoylglutathione lyase